MATWNAQGPAGRLVKHKMNEQGQEWHKMKVERQRRVLAGKEFQRGQVT